MRMEDASSYQIEVDGGKSLERALVNVFTKSGFLADPEHSLRVRVVRGNSVSEWSDVVKGKTQEESFETSAVCGRNVLAMLMRTGSTLWMRVILELLQRLMVVVIGVQ